MQITQSGRVRSCFRTGAAAMVLFAGMAQAQGGGLFEEQSPWIKQEADAQQRVVRGQSPFGYRSYSASVPTDGIAFSTIPSPWITSSQISAASYDSGPPMMMAQAPMGGPVDPFSQPMSGDPSLGGAFIDQPAIWQPYVALQGLFGNKNNMGIGQLMMPLYQDGQHLFFADIRGRFDDSQNSEGNFGLALRKMVNPTWFYGINGFYDYRHTSYGNNFNQGTVGIEAMSVYWEAKMNGYIPESGQKQANALTSAQVVNNNIVVIGGFEKAYYGLDGEIGGLLWEEAMGNMELRGFVGGYWFNASGGSGANFPSIAGPKGRLEFRLYDCPWFGPESRLTLGVEVQNDNVRDFQVAGLARLEIPLGFFNPTRRLTRLERRMLDRIVRDNDIVTVAQQTPAESARDSLTGLALNNVTIVDATTANIPGAVTAAGANSYVIADGSKGAITTTNTIAMQPGQIFRGGGFQVVGSQTGAVTTFGTRPTITLADTTQDIVAVPVASPTRTALVADLNLSGGRNGIADTGLSTNFRVTGNQASNAKVAGFNFTGLAANDKVDNNTASNNGRDTSGALIAGGTGIGFDFNGATAAGSVVSGNTATKNVSVGYMFNGNAAGSITGNTASFNGVNPDGTITTFTDGFFVLGNMTGTFSNNTATNNSGTGVFVFGTTDGTFSNNTATNNGRSMDGTIAQFARGFEFFNSVSATGIVSGNTATNNGDSGFRFGSTVAGKVTGNTATGNGRNTGANPDNANADGFLFTDSVSGNIFANRATNNAHDGFVFADNTKFMSGKVGDGTAANQNIASSNGNYGFDFVQSATGSVNMNTAANNLNGGFSFGTIGAAGSVQNNTASGNGFLGANNLLANGFSINTNNGLFKSNLASGNANNGFALDNGADNDGNFTNAAGATFSSNTAVNNFDMGFRGVNAGTATGNTGSGNTGGGNTFP